MDCSPPGSSVHGFPRQEHWSGLPFPSPGDPPDSGMEPISPTLQADLLQLSLQGSPEVYKVTSKATWKQLLRGLSRLGSGTPRGLRPSDRPICIWIVGTLTCSATLAGFLKVLKSEFHQLPQNLVSRTQRAQSGHRERLLLTNSSNLVQLEVDF